MMIHCIMTEDGQGRIAKVTAYSSLKRREAAASQRPGPFWKLNVPGEAELREMLAKECGAVIYSKPQRRSIAWIDDGVRLTATVSR